MTDLDMTDKEIRDAKERLKQRYNHETGKELPDHVLENLELLAPWSSNLAEVEKRSQLARDTTRNHHSEVLAVFVLLALLAIGGLIGVYGSRFFVGWGAQLAGGLFISLFACAVLLGIVFAALEWVH